MRCETYKSVMDRIASYLGEADGLSVEDAALAQSKINLFVRLGGGFYWWPDVMRLERRTFRPTWDAAAAYNAGTATASMEVFFPTVGRGPFPEDNGLYAQAVADSTGEPPYTKQGDDYVINGAYWAPCAASYSGDAWSERDFAVGDIMVNPDDGRFYWCTVAHTGSGSADLTKFGILTPFVRSVAYEQEGQTAIGDVRFIWDRDPESLPRAARPQKFRLRADYVQVLDLANVVWVEFRIRLPVFAGAKRTDTAAYAAGVTVYDTATGDFWTSLEAINAGESPTSDPAKWTRVEFPYVLAEYVAQSAYAMLVDREQEEPENFAVEDSAGFPLLLAELDKLERQQGQVRQLNVAQGRNRQGGWFY